MVSRNCHGHAFTSESYDIQTCTALKAAASGQMFENDFCTRLFKRVGRFYQSEYVSVGLDNSSSHDSAFVGRIVHAKRVRILPQRFGHPSGGANCCIPIFRNLHTLLREHI